MKRPNTAAPGKEPPGKKRPLSADHKIFADTRIFFIEKGIGNVQLAILKDKVTLRGTIQG
jgi:hypothetical protein